MSLKVSVVTPSYQQGRYIEQTIRSVLGQDYPQIEYIIVDGGSTDNSVEILKSYGDRIRWVSEPDHGQADAINKGFALASGEIFGWVNSDDFYAPGAIRKVVEFFTENPDASFVYGDVVGLDSKGRDYGVRLHIQKRQQIGASDFDVLVKQYDFLVQPACFWRAALWREIGELDLSLHYAMDYEYWMRAAQHHRMYYLPAVLAYERLYGEAKTGSGSLARMEEIAQIAKRYGGEGLPGGYRAEAAAHYTIAAFKQLLRGRLQVARQHLSQAAAQKAPLPKYLRYLAVMLVFGQQSIPTAWLWLNRWRTRWRTKLPQPSYDGFAPM